MFIRRAVLVLAAVATLSCVAHAGDSGADKVRVRMEQIAALNSIDASDVKPWHIVIACEIKKTADQAAVSGTVEEWWKDSSNWRRVITQGDKKLVQVELDDSPRAAGDAGLESSTLELLIEKILHPVGSEGFGTSEPILQHHKFGALEADCIMLTDPMPISLGVVPTSSLPLGLFPTYCVSADNTLRVSYEGGSISAVGNSIGTFQAHKIPLALSVSAGHDLLGSAKVTTLATTPAESIDLSVEGLHPAPGAVPMPSGVLMGSLLHKVPPVYPDEAKQRRAQGKVEMKAEIGTDGRIHSLHVVRSPDNLLSLAALVAVQQWIYKPYVLNGVPTSVDTTIYVNFNLR